MSSELLPKGYKQTEVGVIPDDWDVECLKKISPSLSVGLVINPSSYFDKDGSVPMLVGSHVSENRINWKSANRISKSSNNFLLSSQLSAGDLVTVRVGDPGVTSVVPQELDGCNCASMMIIRKHSSFVSHWLCYVMNSKIGRSQIEHVQYGTAQKQFNISDAVNFLYPFPSLAEQEAIATTLSDTDALIEALEKAIAKKRHIKQGTMQELLTGKRRLPGFGEGNGYKQTEIGSIPEDWDVRPIGDFCTCFSGGTPNTSKSSYYDGDISWITSSDLNETRVQNVQGRISAEGLANSAAKIVKKGTLLLALYGATAGVSAITEIHGAINQAILAITPMNLDVEYLFAYLRLQKDFYIKSYTQGGQPNFSGEIVKSFLVPFPLSEEEQKAIATILSDMDTEIATLEAKLAKTRQLKQGMMHNLLTGRIRLV
ncbi:MAG: hypothetical protein HC851_16795 [Acaryochloris sp. RU_4_1]|nr:hypothetical protein [Acaryochloris sp. RU_4_1]